MTNLTIGITTFSKRFSYIENLLKQLRTYTNVDIIITINGDYKKDFDESYRKDILGICLKHERIFPIFFPEQRGLSKLWNTLMIHSKTDWCLILNDDVEILSSDIISYGQNNLQNFPDLIRINGSFSHFYLHKMLIDELGYFDERLLGFGEEDGDIFFRYIQKYNKWISDVYINGINNLVIDIRDEEIRSGVGKYSAFNREFCFINENPKYVADSNGITGCFGYAMRKNLQDINLYPYEKFFRDNKNNL